jgi:hypothetical protein
MLNMFNNNILQIGKYYLPKYVVNYNLKNLNWDYLFYKENDYDTFLKYIENNPHNELNNASNIFKSFNLNIIKTYYFIFYFLFINGGIYINENIIITPNITNMNFENKLIFVKSTTHDNIFIDCIFCHKHNKFIETFLKNIETCFLENKFNNETDFTLFITKQLYNDIIMYNESITEIDEIDKVSLFNETIYDNISYIYYENITNTYFNHYFNPSEDIFRVPEYPLFYPKMKKKELSSIKIGITFNLIEKLISLFSNGINQNTLYFFELLSNIGYDVIFILDDTKITESNINILYDIFGNKEIKYTKFSNILNYDFDIIIQLSFSFWQDISIINYLKYTNTKVVGYLCGNSYIIDSEKILYNQHKSNLNNKSNFSYTLKNGKPIFDEIWSIPQMVNTNLHYWKTLYRCKCIEVPFIWSNTSIKITTKLLNLSSEDEILYKNRGINKSIGIFEPNISIMKWSLPCILICENTYRNILNKSIINHIYITNIINNNDCNINDFNISGFNNILSTLDIIKDKKCSIETRYNVLDFMSLYCDIAVSHQWENPLNYLYFDLAWMGWPVIHNAHLCKDVGYFYNGFNYEEGGNVLQNVLENHDKNVLSYTFKNRMYIDKYLPSNLELQNQYKKIINELIN